jgi:hypothetical protein
MALAGAVSSWASVRQPGQDAEKAAEGVATLLAGDARLMLPNPDSTITEAIATITATFVAVLRLGLMGPRLRLEDNKLS